MTTLLVLESSVGVPIAPILESPDREIVVVGSREDALRALTEHEVAVCVVTAELDGIATAGAIAADVHARNAHVVLVTDTELDPASIEAAYASGVVDVMPRSIDASILRARISALANIHTRYAREAVRRDAEHARVQALFLATLGEELRPPLNAIVGWVRMLRDGSMREPQRARALETVERSARAQLDLIEEMLDVSRITNHALTLDLVAADLRGIVEAVVEAHRPAAVDKQLTLFAAVDDDVAPMFGDPERLRQVVHRLLGNAVASTPTEGVVTVSLRNAGAEVELAITDTGPRDEANVARRVFDGFTIVRHLVELHDGTVAIENAAAAVGRRFVVNLPAGGRPPRTDDEAR